MRCLKKNRQTLYYALYSGQTPVYAYDEEGNVIYTNVDGEDVPVIETYIAGYGEVIEFEANISFNSGETQMAEYGLDVTKYNAVINADKGEFPFDEQTLIWHTSEPRYDGNGNVLPESADYRVVAVKTSINEERFILRKRSESGDNTPPPSA